MINKTKPILLLYFIVIFTCGFTSLKSRYNCPEKTIEICKQTYFNDSLKLLKEWMIDYGFNKEITLWGDTTYHVYKDKIWRIPGGAEELKIKSNNSYIGVVFTTNHEVEKILYTALKGRNARGRIFYTKSNYKTQHFGFKTGDRLSVVLKKLKGVAYKTERNFPLKNDVCVKVHGLVAFKGVTKTTYDEYICSYCFVNNKLDLIEMDYFRDVTRSPQN